MKPDTKQILKGVGIAAGLQAAGAVVGAAANPPCGPTNSEIFCGPGMGAAMGDVTASGLSTMIGLGLAVFSPKKRAVGVGMMAGPVATNLALSLAVRIFGKSTPAAPAVAPGVDPQSQGNLGGPPAGTTPATTLPTVATTGAT